MTARTTRIAAARSAAFTETKKKVPEETAKQPPKRKKTATKSIKKKKTSSTRGGRLPSRATHPGSTLVALPPRPPPNVDELVAKISDMASKTDKDDPNLINYVMSLLVIPPFPGQVPVEQIPSRAHVTVGHSTAAATATSPTSVVPTTSQLLLQAQHASSGSLSAQAMAADPLLEKLLDDMVEDDGKAKEDGSETFDDEEFDQHADTAALFETATLAVENSNKLIWEQMGATGSGKRHEERTGFDQDGGEGAATTKGGGDNLAPLPPEFDRALSYGSRGVSAWNLFQV